MLGAGANGDPPPKGQEMTGSELTHRRFALGMSQREIAELLGVQQYVVGKLEQAEQPSSRQRELLAKLDRLLPDESDPRKLTAFLRKRARSEDPTRSYLALDALHRLAL